jgi:flagellar biogenesis protein FliO
VRTHRTTTRAKQEETKIAEMVMMTMMMTMMMMVIIIIIIITLIKALSQASHKNSYFSNAAGIFDTSLA